MLLLVGLLTTMELLCAINNVTIFFFGGFHLFIMTLYNILRIPRIIFMNYFANNRKKNHTDIRLRDHSEIYKISRKWLSSYEGVGNYI